VECFFLSNPAERQKYAAGKQGVAKAIAAALIESANNAPGI
jgi:N-acetylmuramoyl-L-alanine amidase